MLPDLELRVYAPLPEVVIVRVSGTVNGRTAAVVATRVGHQLTRAPHVVVDLGEVSAMDLRGVAVFRTLHRQATAAGTEIHLVRAEHDGVLPALRTTGLDQLFTLGSTAEAVIAGLPHRRYIARGFSPQRSPSTRSRWGTRQGRATVDVLRDTILDHDNSPPR